MYVLYNKNIKHYIFIMITSDKDGIRHVIYTFQKITHYNTFGYLVHFRI